MPHPSVVQSGYWSAHKRRTLASHRNAGLEIVLVTRGELTWHVEGRVESVPPGSVFFTLPWETHGSTREQEPGCELHFAVLRLQGRRRGSTRQIAFDPSFGLSAAFSDRLRRQIVRAPRRAWPATETMRFLLPRLVKETALDGDGSPDAITGLAKLVLVELSRSLSTRAPAAAQPPAAERVHAFVRRLAVECHLPWTLEGMADACGLSRTRFADLLKQLTGDTPRMALNRARVERATALLKQTDRPITRVALDCGFGSSQYFAYVYRQYAGRSASDVRAAYTPS
jgi:AraC-like DNA-binding protein/quercetin dioxygenase-like cupin family protein